MQTTLETIIKSLVEFPEQVSVTEVAGEKSVVFEVKVADTDMGKVIGREGKIAAAIREQAKITTTYNPVPVIPSQFCINKL